MMLFKLQIIGKTKDLFAFSISNYIKNVFKDYVTMIFPLDNKLKENYQYIHELCFK